MFDPSGSEGWGISVALCCSASVNSAMFISLCVASAAPGRGSSVELVEGVTEHQVSELMAARRRAHARVLPRRGPPRLGAGEQDAIVPDPAAGHLVGEPARGEADGPGKIGVDPLAGRDPVEEARSG